MEIEEHRRRMPPSPSSSAVGIAPPARRAAPALPHAASSHPLAAFEPRTLVPLLAVTIVLVALAAFYMHGGNVATFTAVQRLTQWLPDPFWSIVTICGAGVVAFALLSPTLARQPRLFAAAIVAAPLAGLYANGMKHLYALPRPPAVLDATRLHVVGEVLRHNTFPSGHAVTAFTLAAVLVFASRTPLVTAAWTLPLAVLVALSRIAVGAHWPADLAAGAAGGWVCGALAVGAIERWRGWNRPFGVRAMAAVAIGIGIALFIVDLGYPQAIAVQFACGVVALAAGLWTLARPRLDGWLPNRPPSSPASPDRR